MVTIIVVLVLFAALSGAALLGWTADSRDPEYDLGRVFDPAPTPCSGALGR